MAEKVDARFNERIWAARKEIALAFMELDEDLSGNQLNINLETDGFNRLRKQKANQAKELIDSCFDLLSTH